MKLWADGKEGSAGAAVEAVIKEQVEEINRKVLARGERAVSALRSAEMQVLEGERSGKVYKKPGTYGSTPSKDTRKLLGDYGHKLRGGQLYRASAPGEAPARRTGNLRMHWKRSVKKRKAAGRYVSVVAVLESKEPYAYDLEKGKGMAPRPFVDKIKSKAEPEIRKIFEEPYT